MEDSRGVMLRQNKDGVFELYQPYAEIEIETEEDFKKFEESMRVAEAVRKAFTSGFILSSSTNEKSAKNTAELLALLEE